MPDLQPVFNALRTLLLKHAAGLDQSDWWENSTATRKPALVLTGKRKVSIQNRLPRATCFAAVIWQKNYIGFYFMPIYAAREKFKLSPRLTKLLKGKACFHIKSLDPQLAAELHALLTQGKKAFKKLGWI